MALNEDKTGAHLMRAQLTRRRLLMLGTAGVLSTVLGRWERIGEVLESGTRIGRAGSRGPSLPVGYWSGADDASATEQAAVVAADRLQTGDTRFARDGARLAIRGLFPQLDPVALHGLEMLTVDVAYEPYHTTPFQAWSFFNGSTPRSSSPVALTLPVDAATGLNLVVTYRTTSMPEPIAVMARFALRDEDDTPKLRAGTYFVGLPDQHGTFPDWQQYQVQRDDGTNGCATGALSCTASGHASHPYLMLSVT
jgi:hypothetical protein